MEKIYGMHTLVGLKLFWSRTPNFSSGTPTFCQMGVLNSCFQNPSESSGCVRLYRGSRLFVCFVALRPRSTAMAMAGRSVNQTKLSWASLNKLVLHILTVLTVQ